MSAPALSVNYNGLSQVSADNLNTYVQWATNAANLRGISGLSGMTVYMQGYSTVMDGGQGFFYWNNASTASDDGGVTTVVPNSSTSGAWSRIISPLVSRYYYLSPITGFSFTIPTSYNTLILDPSGTLGSGTVIMPATVLYDGMLITISSSQTITSLSIAPNTGQAIYGAPTTITSTTPVQFIYRASNLTFYRSA